MRSFVFFAQCAPSVMVAIAATASPPARDREPGILLHRYH
jgi:hypothetical protein